MDLSVTLAFDLRDSVTDFTSFQAHATDILNVYADGEMTEYLVRFAATLDPNGGSLLQWPKYTSSSPTLLTFLDGLTPLELSQDTFREDGFNVLTNLSLKYPL